MKSLRSIVILLIASICLIVAGIPVLAAGTTDRPLAAVERGVLRGIVTAKSDYAIQIGDTSVGISKETVYKVPGTKDATLADISLGMMAVVQTTKVNDKLQASSISVVPITQHFVGKVIAFSYDAATGGNISIQDKQGKLYSLGINAGKIAVQPQGVNVKVGDQVTVVTQRVKNEDEPITVGVVVSMPLEHFSGKVTEFSYDETRGGSISILGKDAKTLTFRIVGGKFTVQPKGVTVKTGDQVTVIVQVLQGQPEAVAVGVSVTIPLQHYLGKVIAFNYNPATGGRILVQDKDGKTLDFAIEAGKFNVQPKDAMVKVDGTVTVVARNEAGKIPVAVGVVIRPTVVQLKGVITRINKEAKLITVGTTVINYNDKTLFQLHGILAIDLNQQATLACLEQADHSLVAITVSVTAP